MKKIYGLCQECILNNKPEWLGKQYKIVGVLTNPRNWIDRFDQVIEIDGELYDCAGHRIGKKKWEAPWFITGHTFTL